MTFSTLISSMLRLGIPMMFGALGILISAKSGIVNMSMEGNMLFTAFAAVYMTYMTGNPLLGQLCGVVFGVLYSLLLGYFIIKCRGHHVVCGLGFNFVAIGVTTVLLSVLFNSSGCSEAVTKFPQMDLPFIGQQSYNIILAVLAPLLVWFMLYKTNLGLRLRSIGENPAAADSVGVDVMYYQFIAMFLAGVLGGLAGSELALGQVGYFAKEMTASKGFVAYSAVIFGGYTPIGVVITTLLLGLLDAFQMRAQSMFNIPGQFLLLLPYLVTIIALIGVGNVKKPMAAGKIYERGNF